MTLKSLTFDDHITAICRSTHFHIRNIGKIRNLLSYDACSTIIHALISCRLDYCNSILYNVPKSKTHFFIGRILFRKNPTKKYSVEIIYMIMTKIRRYKIINNLT